jgi:hypothetical protein
VISRSGDAKDGGDTHLRRKRAEHRRKDWKELWKEFMVEDFDQFQEKKMKLSKKLKIKKIFVGNDVDNDAIQSYVMREY